MSDGVGGAKRPRMDAPSEKPSEKPSDVGEDIVLQPQCAVCRELYARPLVLECGHMFCEGCIVKGKQEQCFLCRQPFDINALRSPCLEMCAIIEHAAQLFPKEDRDNHTFRVLNDPRVSDIQRYTLSVDGVSTELVEQSGFYSSCRFLSPFVTVYAVMRPEYKTAGCPDDISFDDDGMLHVNQNVLSQGYQVEMRVRQHGRDSWTFCMIAETAHNAFDYGWNLFRIEGVVDSQDPDVMPYDYPYGRRECRITLHKSSERPDWLQMFFTAPNGKTSTTVVHHSKKYVEFKLTAGTFKIVDAEVTTTNIEQF